MNDREIRRCRVQVLSSGSGKPCGWGVVVSPRRILTCTHVVQDALEGGAGRTVSVRFPGLPGRPISSAHLTDLLRPTLPDSESDSDIAVIEVAEGELPPEAVVARAYFAEFGSSVELSGYAMKVGLETGHPIAGRRQSALVDHRIPFVASVPDLVTRAGASGTPLFIESCGMVGIVVAAQAQATGFYIPVETLVQVVPDLATASTFETAREIRPPASAEQALRLSLAGGIHQLDRTPQCNIFRNRMAQSSTQAGGSFVCIVAGTPDDLPEECIVRMECEFTAAQERGPPSLAGGLATGEIRRGKGPTPLDWPTQRRFEPVRELQALVRSLHPKLSAQRPPFAEAIRAALDSEIAPLAFHSEVRASGFTRDHRLLLGLWLDLLDELNRPPLAQPLVHFFTFQFETSTRPLQARDGDSGLDAHLEALLSNRPDASILRFFHSRRSYSPILTDDRASLAILPALGPVGRVDTKAWIEDAASILRMRPDEGSVARVRKEYLDEFDGVFGVPLSRIERRSRGAGRVEAG